MHLGLRADKEGRTAALRVIGGFACNEGFVFSLFYLGENRAFGDGPFASSAPTYGARSRAC